MSNYPKGLPRELRGLWRVQYAPRERAIYRRLGKKNMTKYNKMSYIKKIQLIDTIQSHHPEYFDLR